MSVSIAQRNMVQSKGIAVILDYPFENTVEVLDPDGEIQFTNANYLMPLESEL